MIDNSSCWFTSITTDHATSDMKIRLSLTCGAGGVDLAAGAQLAGIPYQWIVLSKTMVYSAAVLTVHGVDGVRHAWGPNTCGCAQVGGRD